MKLTLLRRVGIVTLFLMMFGGCSSHSHHHIVVPSPEMLQPLTIPTVERRYYTSVVEAYQRAVKEIVKGNSQLDAIRRLYKDPQ